MQCNIWGLPVCMFIILSVRLSFRLLTYIFLFKAHMCHYFDCVQCLINTLQPINFYVNELRCEYYLNFFYFVLFVFFWSIVEILLTYGSRIDWRFVLIFLYFTVHKLNKIHNNYFFLPTKLVFKKIYTQRNLLNLKIIYSN